MPKKIASKSDVFRSLEFLRKRELGWKRELGYDDQVSKKLVNSLESFSSNVNNVEGGIFNLEFSLDGSILAAACEKKSILLYDSLTQKQIKSVQDAHSNCVNCIKFLDSYTFASGSDDNTVKTWDVRYLKSPTRTLRGHSNWVKNIEYSSRENRLITSAFDGGIYAWDLNNYTEQGVVYDRVFVMDGLMRTKLTPDGSKMIMCTTHGYMLIVHNLNLETLNSDLQRFKPNIYRLMQESEQNIPIASCSNNLFSPYRKFNRVELVSDFPNTAEVISSLQIHPMGWCALTRNINNDELSEWTSVHDIQERAIEEYLSSYTVARLPQRPQVLSRRTPAEGLGGPTEGRQTPMDLWMGFVTNQNIRAQRMLSSSSRRGSGIRTTRASITVFNSGILSSEHHADPLDLVPPAHAPRSRLVPQRAPALAPHSNQEPRGSHLNAASRPTTEATDSSPGPVGQARRNLHTPAGGLEDHQGPRRDVNLRRNFSAGGSRAERSPEARGGLEIRTEERHRQREGFINTGESDVEMQDEAAANLQARTIEEHQGTSLRGTDLEGRQRTGLGVVASSTEERQVSSPGTRGGCSAAGSNLATSCSVARHIPETSFETSTSRTEIHQRAGRGLEAPTSALEDLQGERRDGNTGGSNLDDAIVEPDARGNLPAATSRTDQRPRGLQASTIHSENRRNVRGESNLQMQVEPEARGNLPVATSHTDQRPRGLQASTENRRDIRGESDVEMQNEAVALSEARRNLHAARSDTGEHQSARRIVSTEESNLQMQVEPEARSNLPVATSHTDRRPRGLQASTIRSENRQNVRGESDVEMQNEAVALSEARRNLHAARSNTGEHQIVNAEERNLQMQVDPEARGNLPAGASRTDQRPRGLHASTIHSENRRDVRGESNLPMQMEPEARGNLPAATSHSDQRPRGLQASTIRSENRRNVRGESNLQMQNEAEALSEARRNLHAARSNTEEHQIVHAEETNLQMQVEPNARGNLPAATSHADQRPRGLQASTIRSENRQNVRGESDVEMQNEALVVSEARRNLHAVRSNTGEDQSARRIVDVEESSLQMQVEPEARGNLPVATSHTNQRPRGLQASTVRSENRQNVRGESNLQMQVEPEARGNLPAATSHTDQRPRGLQASTIPSENRRNVGGESDVEMQNEAVVVSEARRNLHAVRSNTGEDQSARRIVDVEESSLQMQVEPEARGNLPAATSHTDQRPRGLQASPIRSESDVEMQDSRRNLEASTSSVEQHRGTIGRAREDSPERTPYRTRTTLNPTRSTREDPEGTRPSVVEGRRDQGSNPRLGIEGTRSAALASRDNDSSNWGDGRRSGWDSPLAEEVDTEAEELSCRIIQNLPRLTHYMEEPNAGKGFIKELCFSPDGRVICSPYHAGIRLFSFNVSCNELSVCVPEHPQRLHKVAHFKDYHPEIVVSCKFNPYHCMLVSGCLGGQIVWYHPVF